MPKTPMTIEEAKAINDTIGGSLVIVYNDMRLLAPKRDIQEAIERLQSYTPERRAAVMASVSRAMRKMLPKVQKQTASNKQAMQFAQDVAIWFANEVVEGRQSLQVH